MKLSGKNIFKSLLLALTVGTLAAGCIREDIPADCPEPIDVLLQMSVNTKSPLATKTLAPTDAESEIKTLRVYAFIGNETVGHFAYPDPDNYNTYVDGTMNFYMHVEAHSTSLQVVDFYVIANEDAMSPSSTSVSMGFNENTTRAELDNAQFTLIDGISNLSSVWDETTNEYVQTGTLPRGMPNIAKETYTLDMSDETDEEVTSGDHKGHLLVKTIYKGSHTSETISDATEVSNLHFSLERPTGKLGLFAAAVNGSTEPLYIESAKLLEQGARINNYVMPQEESVLQARHSVVEGGIPLTTIAKTTACGIFPLAEDAEGFASAREVSTNYTKIITRDYYPYENPFGNETWNTTTPDPKGHIIEINYKFGTNGDVKTGYVNMPPIKRNHYYGVYCLMSNSGIVSITYSVADWESVQWGVADTDKIIFEYPSYRALRPLGGTLEAPAVGTYYPQPVTYYSETAYPDAEGGIEYSDCFKEGDFLAEFHINHPVGQYWRPTLDNASIDEFNVEVWRRKRNADGTYSTTELEKLKKIESSTDNNQTGYQIFNDSIYGEGGAPFIIRVYPLKQDIQEKTIELRILFRPAWELTDVLSLLINGYREQAPYWNQDLTDKNADPEVLRIKHFNSKDDADAALKGLNNNGTQE